MSANGERVQLFLGAEQRAHADRTLPQGEVCVRSIRSPDKQTENEDSAAIIQLRDNSLVLAVADGVGGSVAGREASNATVRTLSRVLTKLPNETPELRPAILDAVEEANKAVLELSRGAATTASCCTFRPVGSISSNLTVGLGSKTSTSRVLTERAPSRCSRCQISPRTSPRRSKSTPG